MSATPPSSPSSTYTARWYQRAGIWIGIGINPASITLGGGLASQMSFGVLVWLVPLGTLILASLAVLAGTIGRRRREPFSKWSESTFGLGLGSILINLIMALGMMGWGGFQFGLGGTTFGHLLTLSGSTGVVLMAVLILLFGNLGVNRWNVFVWVTTLSSLALAVFALIFVGRQTATQTAVAPFSFGMAFWVIGSIISYASLFVLRCTDFTWDLASDRDVVLDGLAFFGTVLASFFIGMLLFRATGNWNLAEILAGTPLAILGQLFLFISLLSPSLSSMHSGALAFSNVVPLKYWQATAVHVAIGLTLGLFRFDLALLRYLEWVGAILPPAMLVMIFTVWSKRPITINVKIAAWLTGAAVAMMFKLNGQVIHLFAGAMTSFLFLIIAQRVVPTAAESQSMLERKI